MNIEDTAPGGEATPETVDDVVETAETTGTEQSEDADLAAFNKGAAEAVDDDEPVKAAEADPVKSEDDEPKDEPEAKPEAKADDKDADPEKPDEVEAEISTLQLKEKAAERFRELASRPTQEQFDQAKERAAVADKIEEYVEASAATPEQFTSVLGYLQAINSGDPKRMNGAFEAMQQEMAWLAQQLGREVPGISDPLAAHPDLLQEVNGEQLTRQRALEIASQRAVAKRGEEYTERTQGQQQHRQAVDTAMRDIGVLNDKLSAADPDFARKLPMLQPMLEVIRENVPPAQWAAKIETAYRNIPAMPQAETPKPHVSAMPIRPTGSSNGKQRTPQNDLEAFEMGAGLA